MKSSTITVKKLTLLVAAIFLLSGQSFGQVPTTFSYQAVARANDGTPIANKEVIVEISILKGDRCDEEGFSCANVWQEIHSPETNEYGLFNIEIGNGQSTYSGTAANFTDIDWSVATADEYYIKVRVDFGDAQYLNGLADMGTSKLQAVPYSFVAETSETANALSDNNTVKLNDLTDVNASTPTDGQTLIWNTTSGQWEAGLGGSSGNYITTDGTTDLTGDWTIYNNSITISNGTLSTLLGAINTQDIYSDVGQIDKLTSVSLQLGSGVRIKEFSTDGTFALANNERVPTQAAVKTYIDANSTSLWKLDGIKIYPTTISNRVGIGTQFPSAPFHAEVSSDAFLVTGLQTGGNIQDLNAGTRMVFHASKAAFRAGSVTGTQWNTSNVGEYSVALGYNDIASGQSSFSVGQTNTVSNSYAVGMGFNNTVSALAAVAIGEANTASGNYAVALGNNNSVTSAAGFAAGKNQLVGGTNAFTLGKGNTANGISSGAIGKANSTIADYSLATGNGTTIGTYGESAFTAGNSTTANAPYSVVFGDQCTSNLTAVASLTGGVLSTNDSRYSIAFGDNVNAKSYASLVIGRFNDATTQNATSWQATDQAFVVGNGTDNANRSNAFVVFKNGNATMTGTLTQNSDKRLKKEINTLKSSLENINKLRGVSFYWDESHPLVHHSGTDRQIGFIAQEIEKIYPELVVTKNNGYKTVNYTGMIPVLLEAIKEQQKQIEALKQKNTDLQTASNTEIERLSNQNKTLNERLERVEKLLQIGVIGQK